jgi:hypothetical protein
MTKRIQKNSKKVVVKEIFFGDTMHQEVEMAQPEIITNLPALIEGMGVVSHDEKKERGLTTQIIHDMMIRPEGCTREEIIHALKKEFPKKELSALKNTIGALMNVLPQRMGWSVRKEQINPKDKRIVRFFATKSYGPFQQNIAA